MAVKKGILDNFLRPSSHYSDNQKNFRSIFIDKNEDDLKPEPQNFLEASLTDAATFGTQLEHNKNTSGTQNPIPSVQDSSVNKADQHQPAINKEHNWNTIGTHQEHKERNSGTQKEHKRNTSGTQNEREIRLRNTNGTQLEHGKEHKIEHIKNTIGTQKEHIRNTKYGLSYLTGIQKQLVILFYLSCKKTRSHTTEEFSLSHVANTLKIKLGSIKTSLRRLEEKKFINSVQFKKTRGGWTKFELPDPVYRELLENEKEHNWNTNGTQMEHISNTYRNTEKDTKASSSSSLIKTTTTEIEDEWNFDITAYSRFGFTVSQVKQLSSLGMISATEVEQSLIEFSYDLDNNALPPIKTSKINFLMGLLRSGHSYVSEGFKNEQESMISEMARRAESKRKNRLNEKFEAWEASIKDADKKQIEKELPTHLIALYRTYGIGNSEVRKWLFDYYMQYFLESGQSLASL